MCVCGDGVNKCWIRACVCLLFFVPKLVYQRTNNTSLPQLYCVVVVNHNCKKMLHLKTSKPVLMSS